MAEYTPQEQLFKDIILKFRSWENRWREYDKEQHRKPETADELATRLAKRYEVREIK